MQAGASSPRDLSGTSTLRDHLWFKAIVQQYPRLFTPRAFTTAMLNAAQSHGAEVRRGRVTGIAQRAGGSTVEGVEVDGGVIEADAVVVAMGPWSVMSAKWMSLPAVFGQAKSEPRLRHRH